MIGAGVAGAALFGCGGGDGEQPAPAAQPKGAAAPAGSPGAAAAPAGQPPVAVKAADFQKMPLAQMFKDLDPMRLRYLPGQVEALKKGPVTGGTLQYSRDAPPTYDVLGVGALFVSSFPGTHNSLLTFEMNGDFGPFGATKIIADLPQGYEFVDNTTLVFKLRNEPIYWHDHPPVKGREFTIEDLKYGVEALKKAPTQGPTYRDVDTITTPDAKTLVIRFKQSAAYFLRASATPYQWLVAKEQVEDGSLAKWAIGTGAFRLVKSEPTVGIRFERNPKYFKTDPIYSTGKKLPFLDAIDGKALPDLATNNAAWAAGQIDYGYAVNVSRTDVVERLRDRPDAVIVMVPPPPSYFPLIAMNSQTAPFTDVRVRRALSMAIDRQAMIEGIAGGVAAPAYGQDWTYFDRADNPWPWTMKELGPYIAYNPKEAKALLQAAGFTKGLGRPIELGFATSDSGTNAAVWLAMADFWKQELGIEVQISMAPDNPAFAQKLRSKGGLYQDLHVATPLPAWDPDDWAFGQLNSKSTANFYKVNDAKIDELSEKQQRILDVNERRQVLKQLMDRDLDQMYRLWGIDFYKFTIRSPKLFNFADHYLAWLTPGWGERKLEMAWKA
ncbi:MAG: ABC transporter substrate-binding protein [Chloroflexi bacterium]|nr:ABC transporter substrate-binding protein [Chloroflexota bacterium]